MIFATGQKTLSLHAVAPHGESIGVIIGIITHAVGSSLIKKNQSSFEKTFHTVLSNGEIWMRYSPYDTSIYTLMFTIEGVLTITPPFVNSMKIMSFFYINQLKGHNGL